MKKDRAAVGESKYHHGDLRRALLEGAIGLIEESGVASLSLREVARKIGVTSAAPYHHFKDREALLLQLAIRGYELLLHALESARDGARAAMGEGRDEIEAETRAYLAFSREHAAYYSVMFTGVLAAIPPSPEMRAIADRCFLVVAESVVKATGLAAKQAAEVALCVWSLLHGLGALDRSGMLEEDRAEQERVAIEGVLGLIRGFSGQRSEAS